MEIFSGNVMRALQVKKYGMQSFSLDKKPKTYKVEECLLLRKFPPGNDEREIRKPGL
jgi:hypothetical protein